MAAMPTRRRSLGLLCLLCVLMLRAPAITVRITEADGARVQVRLYPGDVLRIDLHAEPAAGLQWTLLGHTPAQLEPLASTQRVFGGRLSNQGSSSFAWKAVSAGEADLVLGYGSPTARSTHPERTLQVHLTLTAEPLTADAARSVLLAQLEPVGTYMRSEPCGDCSALQERLAFYRAPRASIFLLRRTYKDAPGGTLTSITSGLWTTRKGTADPTATLYQLAGSDAAYLLRLDGDRLVPLDAQQIPFPAPPGGDSSFHRVPAP
jgi:predicted secreted protein